MGGNRLGPRPGLFHGGHRRSDAFGVSVALTAVFPVRPG